MIHYTPKHGSWLNQIEIWFGVLQKRVIRRGDFRSKADLMRRILAYILYYNENLAHPYRWTYTGQPWRHKGMNLRNARLYFTRPGVRHLQIPGS